MTPDQQAAYERMKAQIDKMMQLVTGVDTLHPRTTPTEAAVAPKEPSPYSS